MGVNPQKEDKFIRLVFPSLTQDRREQLIKIANQEKETCRVEIKKHREGAIKKVNAAFNEKAMSEDQKMFLEKEIQKEIDKANENAEMLTDKKEKELKEI